MDTDGKGISSITEDGILVQGREYPIDILILSTGYRTPVYANGSPAARAGVQVFGRDGLGMDEKWLEQGVATLHGLYTHRFPNLFSVGHAQAGAAANFILTLDVMASHIADVIKEAQSRVGRPELGMVIEVEREAEENWTAECMKRAAWYAGMSSCTPDSPQQKEKPWLCWMKKMPKKSRASGRSEGMESYIGVLNAWKADGLLKGLKLSILS